MLGKLRLLTEGLCAMAHLNTKCVLGRRPSTKPIGTLSSNAQTAGEATDTLPGLIGVPTSPSQSPRALRHTMVTHIS